MRLRSLLFVPGDRPERFAKAAASGADALILDLEDSVVPARKAEARAAVTAYLNPPRDAGPRKVILSWGPDGEVARASARDGEGSRSSESLSGLPPPPLAQARAIPLPASGEDFSPHLFVRVNPLDSPFITDDLAALASAHPDGLVLPKAEGAADIDRLAARLALPILPVATETPAAVFQLGTYAQVGQHLAGLTWGAEDLPAAIGAATAREADGGYTPPYQLVRSLALFAAHAAGVPAIETVYPDFRDLDGLGAYAARARRDGFTGMMAIHPAQVPVINATFTPSPDELAHARAVVDLFAANPAVGALQLDGRMVDAPHLKAAQRLLAAAQ